ncbi:MAG: DNA-protecting protein DprA [Lentisphaerae bacterium]|nr:DNA-protecting protein DprA [Lentisphaerota bacterium]
MHDREAYIALNMMERVGPVGVRSLKESLGSVRAVFEADADALVTAKGIGKDFAAAVVKQRGEVDWQAEEEKANALGARILTPCDPEYPAPLAEIHDPPLALYVKGGLQSGDRHAIAVVGTRRPTHYGKDQAGRLAYGLANAGMTVVSGLATGIDTEAHGAALNASGRTLAVLGGALDCLYPASNKGLADRIAESGAVISEFPLGRQPDKTTFPMRNRIVSGLSMGVVVVEAGARSGALITCAQAASQGRLVFAVPGRVDVPSASGCLSLIRDGAKLVTCLDDVLQEFEYLVRPTAEEPEAPRARQSAGLSDTEAKLADLLEEGECDVDSLIRSSHMSPATVNAALFSLEMKRVIRMLPGRIVELVQG